MTPPDNSLAALKPDNCPFCGGEAQCYKLPSKAYPENYIYKVECWNDDCPLNTGYELAQDAIAAWNTRATPIPAVSVGDKALALEMFDRDSVRNKQNMYQFRDEDIDLIHAALTAPAPANVDLSSLSHEVGLDALQAGNKSVLDGVDFTLSWLSDHYTITKKE